MFKRKIKTESEVFSEQRYKDAAIVIYHQLSKNNQHVSNDQRPVKAPVEGWVDEDTDPIPRTQHVNDTPQETVDYTQPNVKSKFCTLM